MSERWRKIPRWPYEASTLGRIRRQGDSAALTPFKDRDDYQRVTLQDGGRRKTFGVHTLVMLAFEGPPEVLHGPGGKQDNSPGNLRYGSRRENEREKRSFPGSTPDVSPGLMGLTGLDETEDGIGRVVSPPLTVVSPVACELG